MRKKCGAKTKSGEACHAWAMPNGFCRNHGGEFTSSKVPPETEKEKTQKEKCCAGSIFEDLFSIWALLAINLFNSVGEFILESFFSKKKAGDKK
jgi:hypothetical protein